MSFDFAAFEAKIMQVIGVLPSLGNLIVAAEAVAPKAAGLTKAGLVINTAIAAEPLLAGSEQILAAAVTGMVAAYRSAGTLPTPTPAAAPVAPAA